MEAIDERMLGLAARAASRAVGSVEPNPCVGCVIGSCEGDVLGVGWHRRFGGAHAEVEALRAVAARGLSAQGATAWVTLEPCAHHGKTPPCCDALIGTGIARVVVARRDPHEVSAGGVERLRGAGVAVDVVDGPAGAVRLSAPFVKRVETGLPWVIAKWAQTVDGRIATRAGESQWISGERSRRMVHRWRGRVDIVLSAIGTVLADDPRLNARGVCVRRVARRVVVDPSARTPVDGALVGTIGEGPVTIATAQGGDDAGLTERRARLAAAGCDVIETPVREGHATRLDLTALCRSLVERYDAMRVFVEGGPRLIGGLLDEGLVDEARVFVGSMVLGDAAAHAVASGHELERLREASRFDLIGMKQVDSDALLWYWRSGAH